jgi:hypothetical protein
MRRKRSDKDRAYDKEYRARNREKYRGYNRERRQRLKDHVRALKDVPCADCKRRYPFYVMDFDHLPTSKKSFGIAKYLARNLVSNYAAVDAEIAKCDVVCANCHRIRTHERADAKGMPQKRAA